MPGWLFLANVLLFGASGALLLWGGRRDTRLQSLGAVFVLIATAFSHPLIVRMSDSTWLNRALAMICADAFCAAALWQFVWAFPERPNLEQKGLQRVGRCFVWGSAALGIFLVGVNLLASLPSNVAWATNETIETIVRAFRRDTLNSSYWLLTFGIGLLAFPYLGWKTLGDEIPLARRRVNFVFFALAVGIGPMVLAVVGSIFFPVLGQAPWRQIVGIALYAALASTVPAIAYAVLVERVMSIEFTVARSRQWQIARTCASYFGLIPLSYLFVDVYIHRDLSLATYLDGGRGFSLFALLFTGFTALTFRYQLLFGVDRWFRADRANPAESLSRLEVLLKGTQTIRDATEALVTAIDRAIGPTSVGVLVVNDDGSRLIPLSGLAPSMAADSALADLVRTTTPDAPLRMTASGSVFPLLPEDDQKWAATLGVDVMAPLLGSTGALFGVVYLGEARNGLPYSHQDCALLRSMCAQVGLRIENQWLRDRPSPRGEPDLVPREPGAHWKHEPAEICLRCSRAWPSTTARCTCGSAVAPGALPLVTAGKFRLERQIGSGGMGVVYLATDLVLGRRVALKTMPRVTDSLAERLGREARAMATVLHPNLALIYGAERWRGNPVLIVEYLEGGTVLDNLRRGPFSIDEALGLGILMADVLDRLHGAGILHRDVKPSNIGYTLEGAPKLLDLGLAAAFATPFEAPNSSRTPTVASLQGDYAVTSDSRQLGTLRYMAPEALEGAPPRPSFDLWALNVVLYEVIAGRHPLAQMTGPGLLKGIQRAAFLDIRVERTDCPVELATFFKDALALDAHRRPHSAAELRAVLQSFLTTS